MGHRKIYRLRPRIADRSHFRFLALPFELRRMIYHHAFVRPKIHIVFSNDKKILDVARITRRRKSKLNNRYGSYFVGPDSLGEYATISLNILQCNRVIYKEASEIFYSENLFSFGPRDDQTFLALCAFMGDRGATTGGLIRHIEIRELWNHTEIWSLKNGMRTRIMQA